ncbi:MAG: tetratricopeptide repeat protein [Candidatus Omnitrophica bacterium]|nr:tetratricopeptide repeat protein [Candidatus Omnitrophota bacterium]
MKKVITRSVLILVVVYVVLSALSWKGEYDAERSLWNINKQMDLVSREPESTPDAAFSQLIERYRSFIKAYPHSPLAPEAYMFIAKVDLIKKNYDAARKDLAQIPVDFPNDKENIVRALAAIGETYEWQGNWNKARSQYESIIRQYPTTTVGLKLPLYIASQEAKNEPSDVPALYTEVIRQYKNLEERYPQKEIKVEALKMLCTASLMRQDWRNSIQYAKQMMFMNYTDKSIGEAMLIINRVSILRMKDYDTPIAIYKEFIKKYPDHPMYAVIKRMVASIEMLKKKNLTFTAPVPQNSK